MNLTTRRPTLGVGGLALGATLGMPVSATAYTAPTAGRAIGRRGALFAVAMLFGALLAAPAGAAASTLQVEPLGDFVPMGLNDAGNVVGFGGFPTKAFLFTDAGGLTTLPPLPGYQDAEAQEINESHQVVGTSGVLIEPPPHATLWVNGQPQDLGVLQPGGSSFGRAVNDAGTVVGSATVGSSTHAFVKTAGSSMIDITPSASNAVAEDVNNLGEVTGRINSQAFRWSGGVLTLLGPPPGFTFSAGFGINDEGQIAASVTSATGNSERVARHTPGIGWEILGGAGKTNIGWAVNDTGTVVGEGIPGTGLVQAVIFIDGLGFFALEDFVDTDNWFLRLASGINEGGQIVVSGFSRTTGEHAALRLTPASAPPPTDSMHVDNITLTLRPGRGSVVGIATVPVLTESNAPVAGATVTGDWLVNGVIVQAGRSGTTGSNGRATIRSTRLTVSSGSVVTFCVTDVTQSNFTYDPSANVETCQAAAV